MTSENCKHFDPQEGCKCRLCDTKGNLLNTQKKPMLVGKYPKEYRNFKGEIVTRLPDSKLPVLGPDSFIDYKKITGTGSTKKVYKKKDWTKE